MYHSLFLSALLIAFGCDNQTDETPKPKEPTSENAETSPKADKEAPKPCENGAKVETVKL